MTMTSVMASARETIRWKSHRGARPPWSGRSAVPVLSMLDRMTYCNYYRLTWVDESETPGSPFSAPIQLRRVDPLTEAGSNAVSVFTGPSMD